MRLHKAIALLFPGGGAHYQGMGKIFYDTFPAFRAYFSHASDLLGYDMAKLCFETEEDILADMHYSQAAIYTVSMAMYAHYRDICYMPPMAMAGHSLGQYAALAAAGVFSFEDGLRIVQKRGELLHSSGITHDGRMMAVNGMTANICEQILQGAGHVYISNYNSPEQLILSGTAAAITAVEKEIIKAGGQPRILNIPTCSHCCMMQDAAPVFADFLEQVALRTPQLPVYNNITGEIFASVSDIRTQLVQHLLLPVQWESTITHMVNRGAKLFVEMGPQRILKRLQAYHPSAPATLAFDDVADKQLLQTIYTHYQREGQKYIDQCMVLAISRPHKKQIDNFTQQQLSACWQELTTYKSQLNGTPSDQDLCNAARNVISRLLQHKGYTTIEQAGLLASLPEF